VAGPTSDGFYRVRVADKSKTPDELSAIGKNLARNPVVDLTAVQR
jgi:hypothetical protein